jgi:hypothetical protein
MYEGQPVFLCESSQLGIPSIFPNNGGMKEFFPEGYELMYKYGNNIDFEDKLELLKSKTLLIKESERVKKHIMNLLSDDNYINRLNWILNNDV